MLAASMAQTSCGGAWPRTRESRMGKSRTDTSHSCWKWGSSGGRGTRPSANQGHAQWVLRSRMASSRSCSTPADYRERSPIDTFMTDRSLPADGNADLRTLVVAPHHFRRRDAALHAAEVED